MTIVGGTYDEICFEPRWEEKFGSGLRGCRVINSLNPGLPINFYTFGDKNTKLFLGRVNKAFPSMTSYVSEIQKIISFHYDYPLGTPHIAPRLDTIEKTNNNLKATGDDILFFG